MAETDVLKAMKRENKNLLWRDLQDHKRPWLYRIKYATKNRNEYITNIIAYSLPEAESHLIKLCQNNGFLPIIIETESISRVDDILPSVIGMKKKEIETEKPTPQRQDPEKKWGWNKR